MRLSNLSLLVSLFFLPEREQRVYTSVKNKGRFLYSKMILEPFRCLSYFLFFAFPFREKNFL